MVNGNPVLFYAAWPLGYHNVEAERKAQALAQAGYDVIYVAGVGTRDPRISRAGKAVDRVRRKLAGSHAVATVDDGMRTAGVAVIPPRRLGPVFEFNVRWLERQLAAVVRPWEEAVAWIRWPTQELVELMVRRPPRAVVYECVDPHHLSPGIVGPWREVLESAERALVRIADAVVVCGERLAERFRGWGADVRIISHGVDSERFAAAPRESVTVGDGVVAGCVGTLDYRLDVELLRALAAAHPDWRLRLVGPVQEGFDRHAFGDLANVTVEPPVPQLELPRLLSELDVALLPYVDTDHSAFLCPVKILEYLAAGLPAVGRPSAALERFADYVMFGSDPVSFVTAVEAAVCHDGADDVVERRRVAAEHDWSRRLQEVTELVDDLLRARSAAAPGRPR